MGYLRLKLFFIIFALLPIFYSIKGFCCEPTNPVVRPLFGSATAIRNELRWLIGSAEEEVRVAMDRFTDYALADALVTAARRGRRVRVVVGADQRDLVVGKALGDHLRAGGVEVVYLRRENNLYDRFVIIDERLVVVGSYPLVEDAATSPFADVVMIEDAGVVAEYGSYFDFLWNAAK